MDIDKLINAIWEGKEWIFSGIGITVLGVIGKLVIRKKADEKSTNCNLEIKMRDTNNVSGGNNITGKQNQIFQNDNSNTISVEGNGNIAGNGNIVMNNYINHNENTKETVNSWFAERFEIFLALLNDARRFNEKEYTVEYISSLLGLKNVDDLKVYLTQGKEPDDEFKRKFVEVFGVNEEWMVYNRGKFPFASNISFLGSNPMDILRREDLKNISKFIVVIGEVEGRRIACIVRVKNELCYELYPKYFTLNSNVGGTGTNDLVNFYRFLREADKIEKLDETAYVATEEQMVKLMNGEISSKKVERFEVAKCFIDDFMCISENKIERNRNYWDKEFISVQEIIAANLKDVDRINQEYDSEIIMKKLREDFRDEEEDGNDIDMFDSSTPFFSYRFGKAFPGVRGTKEFTDSLKKTIEWKKNGGTYMVV